LRCRIGPVGLQGALTHPVVIDTDQERDVCGVPFYPGALSAFHDRSARHFTDTIVDAVTAFGEGANAFRLRYVGWPIASNGSD
jgi:hypothetical protein